MRAAVLNANTSTTGAHLRIEEVARPEVRPGYLLLRVLACGVCRTDLHIAEGDLPVLCADLVPGHQIVGDVVDGGSQAIPTGSRVGVSWMGGTDGDCFFCRNNMENLCDQPTFTGYSVNGGYAEFALVREDFAHPLPPDMDATHTAPLLCAGIIGFRSLRVAGVMPGERVGLFGFGNSATLTLPVLKAWGCDVYVVTRGEEHRSTAARAGCNMGRSRGCQASCGTGPCSHVCAQR